MRKLLTAMVIGVACLSAAPAMAATILTWSSADTNKSYTVNFNGLVGGNLVAGLTGQISYKLLTAAGNTWTFGYSVLNTSSSPITDSRISIWGFNSTPNIVSTSSTGLFDVTSSGNIPGLPFNAEACYRTANGGQCAGGAGGGVSIGDPAAAGTFTLVFNGAQTNVSLEDLFVRYQSIAGTAFGDSGVGVPTGGGTAVPEPATWAMMIAGFGLAGTMIRRHRRQQAIA